MKQFKIVNVSFCLVKQSAVSTCGVEVIAPYILVEQVDPADRDSDFYSRGVVVKQEIGMNHVANSLRNVC